MNSIYSTLVDLGAQQESSRLERFQRAWAAYYGKMPKALPVKPGKADDNIRLNFNRLIVDKGVSFLFGKEIEFEIDQNETTPEEEWLKGCWQQNRKMTLLQKLALNGGVCGHCFIKIRLQPNLRYPRLIVLDPETVTVSLAVDDLDDVIRYQIQYPSTDPKTGKPAAVRQVIEQDGLTWKITDQIGDVENLHWVTTNEQRWPYTWAPIVGAQNLPAPNEFWGMSDLEDDILEVNRAINFTVSNNGRILRYHGHPKTWGKGFQANELCVDADGTIVLPSPQSELHNLEMQNDLSSSNEFYNRLKEALHELSRIPEVATGKLENMNGLSGLALQILYQPLLEKTETKRLLYGELLVELNRRLLALGGFGEENYTQLHWPEMLPADPVQERQAAIIDQQLGVSDDTLMMRLGYDPDLEREKKTAHTEQMGDNLLTAFDRGQ